MEYPTKRIGEWCGFNSSRLVLLPPTNPALDASEPWVDRPLRQHAKDGRKFSYTERQLESAETHDPLWNAAQKQMVLTGWMHGYLRMY